MDLVKFKVIQEWPWLRSIKEIQKFLGFCNFYQHFIHNYLHIARPLFNLTCKESPWAWTDDCETTFRGLQVTLTTSPVLILPNYNKPFTLITDASDFATGAILEQDDALGQSHPMAYYSKSLQPMECNYEIHDKELLTIILLRIVGPPNVR
jgi:hypothetical protein